MPQGPKGKGWERMPQARLGEILTCVADDVEEKATSDARPPKIERAMHTARQGLKFWVSETAKQCLVLLQQQKSALCTGLERLTMCCF